MKLLFAGASYTGRYLARNFGHEVHFLSRGDVRESGLLPFGAHGESLSDYDVLVDTVPALESGLAYPELYAAAKRLIHLSSTSVFAEDFRADRPEDLPVFNEESPAAPQTSRGQKRLDLEKEILRVKPDAVILRCGGIYGPDRGLIEHFRQGDFRRADTNNRMVSRIHVHDLSSLILSCAAKSSVPQLVCAVDPHPALNSEVFSFLEQQLEISVPGSWRQEKPSGRRVVSLHCGRLIEFRFPSYREGFADTIARLRAAGKLP